MKYLRKKQEIQKLYNGFILFFTFFMECFYLFGAYCFLWNDSKNALESCVWIDTRWD